MAQREITEPVEVLNAEGRADTFGWSRSLVFNYDPAVLRNLPLMNTSQDRYILFSPSHVLIFEALDEGIYGTVNIHLLTLKEKAVLSHSRHFNFPLGSLGLPPRSDTGDVKVPLKRGFVEFAAMNGGPRLVKVDIPSFANYRSLRGVVVLSPPDAPGGLNAPVPPPGEESLLTCLPWRGEKNAFRLARRSPWYSAEGVVQVGGQNIPFVKDRAWGIFEWSRGIRPRKDQSYWAAGCGMEGPRQVSFSVGFGQVDSSYATENAFFVDGRLHKLDQVTFHISPRDWLLPWHFTSNDDRLEMTFTPQFEWKERHLFFLINYQSHRRVWGSFSGRVILDSGEILSFRNISGYATRQRVS
jgi:hypothetical protein